MRLYQALRLEPGEKSPCIAFVGAGGKTSALFTLAREVVGMLTQGERTTVLVTTTTHLSTAQAAQADQHWIVASPADIERLASQAPSGVLLVSGEPNSEGRLVSPSGAIFEALHRLAVSRNLPLLIEADGARMLPLKAPAPHEPAIPAFVDIVVVVAGLSAVGKPLSPQTVHRPEIFAALSGISLSQPITASALETVLVHPQGGLKNIPASARRVVLLNQADSPTQRSIAGSLSGALLKSYHAVIAASLYPPSIIPHPSTLTPPNIHTVHERIAGIILAGGGSQRFGVPKPMLLWRGEPFIRHVVRAAQGAGLSPVIVVAGEHTSDLRQACAGLGIELVHNPDWSLGQSTSVRAGVIHLPQAIGAAVFLLVDQPQVPAGLVRSLVESHARDLAPIIAPLVAGRRANPVLFDRQTFPELAALQGDVGGRALFSKYPINWVTWHDHNVLLDVDTPEDYARLLELDSG